MIELTQTEGLIVGYGVAALALAALIGLYELACWSVSRWRKPRVLSYPLCDARGVRMYPGKITYY